MNKISLLLGLTLITLPLFAASSLKDVLSLRPGSVYQKSYKTSGEDKNFSYEINRKDNLIKSVRIDFKKPRSPQEFLSPEVKGHCMVQVPAGDVVKNRYFFFETEKHRRYELTALKMIKSILIQDIPGAVDNKACTFKDFDPQSTMKNEIRKIK
jgi:hypothetical protein